MPYSGEHACRIKEPGGFQPDTFRRISRNHEGKKYSVIIGKLKGETTMTEQAYRYPKDTWTADSARAHCKNHDGSFEAASESASDPSEVERRFMRKMELRVEGEGKTPKITGYAAVFNAWADIGGWFREMIRPGAFSKTIKEADIHALWNHDTNFVLGRNRSKTLSLKEDDKGLAVEIIPPEAGWANDLLTSMRRGDVNQMSFGFRVNKQEINYEKDERVLIDVTLYDVSVVTKAAYPQTSAHVRSLFKKDGDIPENIPEIEVDEERWKILDEIVRKIKAGEKFTEEQKRELESYFPKDPVPPEKHTEDPPKPPEKHLEDKPTEPPEKHSDTPTGKDKFHQLLIRAERIAPSKTS